MENQNHLQTKVLSINISCCENCPKVLNKKLLKMPGVQSVTIDTEENLVYISGVIDATMLLNKVAKMGKRVQLLSADEQPTKHVDKNHSHHTRYEGRGNQFTAPDKGKQYSNCCCGDRRHNSQQKVEKKEEHKCEAYVAPTVDPRVCKDFFCKTHPQGRVMVDRVPAENSGTFFGGMGVLPIHGGYGPSYGGGSYQYPGGHGGWYGQQPPQFGYGQAPPRIPQHPFVFR